MHKYMTGMPVILNQEPKANLCFLFFVAQVQPDIDPLSCVEQLSEIHSQFSKHRPCCQNSSQTLQSQLTGTAANSADPVSRLCSDDMASLVSSTNKFQFRESGSSCSSHTAWVRCSFSSGQIYQLSAQCFAGNCSANSLIPSCRFPDFMTTKANTLI